MKELIFITSNSAKLMHAKHLCRNYAVRISKQKNYGIGYQEPRIDNREELIRRSVEDAIKRFNKATPNPENKFFFIEDTSVIINALSKEKEFPGVDIKYWMRENSFLSVDEKLKYFGNDRSAIVRSDVILIFPKKLADKLNQTYKVFTSQVHGTITPEEFKVKTQPLFPWLSDTTFNKWFIPKGCKLPISLLSIKDADFFDFRAGAFNEMLKFLESAGFIQSLESSNIRNKTLSAQLNLFSPYVFIICGQTCAGKTTIASHLINKYKYYHVEASDFMYLSFYERHGLTSNVNIGDFAEDALKKNVSIVVDQIIENIKILKNTPIVITGFRNAKEIESFCQQYKGIYPIKSVYIEANETVRYERCLKRGRHDSQKNLDDFKEKDIQQNNMGLDKIMETYKDDTIENNSTIDDYYQRFETFYQMQLDAINKFDFIIPGVITSKKLQNAIIQTLAEQSDLDKYHTTTEIANLINLNENYSNKPKNKNNVSRYFNQNYHPYFEIKINDSGHACYRLSQTGIAYSIFLKK